MTYSAGILGTGGVAGLGFIGTNESFENRSHVRSSHAGGYEAANGIELIAACDTNEEQLARFGDMYDIPESNRYEDHQVMLDEEDLDVLSVCTPTFLHHEHTLDAVNASNPPDVIWCEKPIASSVTEGSEMVEACANAGIDLVVNFPRRFDDDFRTLRDHVQSGELVGTVESINLQFKRELLRNGAHMIDAVVYLLGRRVENLSGFLTGGEELSSSIAGTEDIDDTGGGALLTMDDGAFVTVDCTVSREIWSGYIRILGTEGTVHVGHGDAEWRYRSFDGSNHVETALPDEFEGGRSPDIDTAFPNAAAHIVDLLEDEIENRSPGADATHVMEILTGIFVSSYTVSHLSLPMSRPLRDVSIRSW